MPASGVRRVCSCLLHPILRLSLVDGLPLHIRRGVRPTALQGDYVVNHIAGAWPCRQMRGWAGMLPLEGCSSCFAALYAPVGVTLDSRRCGRWRGCAASEEKLGKNEEGGELIMGCLAQIQSTPKWNDCGAVQECSHAVFGYSTEEFFFGSVVGGKKFIPHNGRSSGVHHF